MQGYVRADGRKGIRNLVVVAYLVECGHHVAREIALPWRQQGVHLVGFPGCFPNAYATRVLECIGTHPNGFSQVMRNLRTARTTGMWRAR